MASHSLVIKAAGTAAAGNPAFSVYVNGKLVAADVVVTADYRKGEWYDYTVTYESDAASDDIKIVYANDYYDKATGSDRNLFVNTLTLDGKTFHAAVAQGATANLGYQGGLTSAAMWANGSLGVNSSQFFGEAHGALKYLGIAYSGAEFSDNKLGDWNKAVSFPSDTNIDYYASKGLNTLRLPILWEQVQPVRGGAIDEAYVAQIKHVVEYAATKGITVVVDTHDFGQAYGELIGGAAVTNADFAEYWGTLAEVLKDSPNVIFGLMNEPHVQTPAAWLETANAAIAAIRATGAAQTILVPGSAWDGAYNWLTSGNAATVGKGVVDPLDNYAFEVHQYIDLGSTGTTATAVSSTIGVERLQAITAWAKANDAKLFLGEFGVGSDATSLTALEKMLAYMESHSDVWLGGTYWAAGNDNYFSIDPQATGDRAQMDVLERYAPNEADTYLPGDVLYVSGNKTYYVDGSIETRTYAGGVLTQRQFDRVDGAKELYQYGITGKAYATQHVSYDAKGQLVAFEQLSSGGKLVFTKAVDAATGAVTSSSYGAAGLLASQSIVFKDGAVQTKTYAADGIKLTLDTLVHADGSKDVWSFAASGTSQHTLFDAKGVVTSYVTARADGQATYIKTVDAVTKAATNITADYAASGALTTRTIVQPDGTRVTHSFAADGATMVSSTTVRTDGSREVHSFGATGSANRLTGASREDVLVGRDGNDTLAGGAAVDQLTGGKGVDTFVFARGGGNDRITDFGRDGEADRIDISNYTATGLKAVLKQDGADTLISFTNGEAIRVIGVTAANLSATASGFTFVQAPVAKAAAASLVSGLVPVTEVLTALTVRQTQQNSGQSWSYQTTADGTTRYELRAGDSISWDGTAKERSETYDVNKLDAGKTYKISFDVMIEPGAKNTATWMTLVQLQSTFDAGEVGHSPPFALEMSGDKMRIVTRDSTTAITTDLNDFRYVRHYTDSADIERGRWYDFDIEITFDPFGNGHLVVMRDGVTLVDYTGALGFNDTIGAYLKQGVYRASSSETIAVNFRDTTIEQVQQADASMTAPSGIAINDASVAENAVAGTLVGTVSAIDLKNQAIGYTLVDDAKGLFKIDAKTGAVTTTAALDYEQRSAYDIVVRATSTGGVTSDKTMTILVDNVDEAPTALKLDHRTIAENLAAGTLIGTVRGTDPEGGAMTYSIVGGEKLPFAIDAKSGAITTTASLDYEARNAYALMLRATDAGGHAIDRAVTIGVLDIDDYQTAAQVSLQLLGASSAELVSIH